MHYLGFREGVVSQLLRHGGIILKLYVEQRTQYHIRPPSWVPVQHQLTLLLAVVSLERRSNCHLNVHRLRERREPLLGAAEARPAFGGVQAAQLLPGSVDGARHARDATLALLSHVVRVRCRGEVRRFFLCSLFCVDFPGPVFMFTLCTLPCFR